MKPLIKKHFELLEAIQSNYKLRNKEPGALEKAIAACNQQIAIAPEVAQLFQQEFEELSQFAVEQALPESAVALPAHTGYTQLAIIREKQGRLTEAICLCRENVPRIVANIRIFPWEQGIDAIGLAMS